LEKIAKGDKDVTEEKGMKIEEKVAHVPKQEPISLSALKESNNHSNTVKTPNTLPTKEASEEKKASLKDVLSRIPQHQNTTSSHIVEEKPREVIEPKKEELFIKPEPIIVEEVKIEPEIIPEIKPETKEEVIEQKAKPEEIKVEEIIYKEEPQKEPEPVVMKKEELAKDSWQKRKAKKEVPEDVLRKVLE